MTNQLVSLTDARLEPVSIFGTELICDQATSSVRTLVYQGTRAHLLDPIKLNIRGHIYRGGRNTWR